MDCRCSSPFRLLEGVDGLGYARDHLTLVWSRGVVQNSGYVCPDSGQLWILEYPEHGAQRGPARLRVISDAEWQAAKPAGLGRPRDDVHSGERWRVVKDMPASGITTWAAPFTGGFECVIPRDTVLVVENDPPMGASAVYCVPEHYRELEAVFVAREDYQAEKYSGYALVIPLDDFSSALSPL
jgi:hypothetical protein